MKMCYLFLLISFLMSCSNDEFVTKEYSVNNQKANTIEQNIHDYIRTFRKVVSRNAVDYKLSPFIYEGDTVMYIVNYGNLASSGADWNVGYHYNANRKIARKN